jgi:hypothetical protein
MTERRSAILPGELNLGKLLANSGASKERQETKVTHGREVNADHRAAGGAKHKSLDPTLWASRQKARNGRGR